mgnify:CR=1
MEGWRKFATGLLLRWESENSFEPPSQQAKQTGAGEQRVDGRVSAE